MPNENINSVFTDFRETVNMTPGELDAWAQSDNYDAYEERKNKGQPIDEPRHDVQRLLETPKSQWADEDDGFNEVEQANEVLGFVSRMRGVEQGEAMPGTDPELSKRDASLINWGFDPSPQSSDFTGDRER
jgi:hypothetical protein